MGGLAATLPFFSFNKTQNRDTFAGKKRLARTWTFLDCNQSEFLGWKSFTRSYIRDLEVATNGEVSIELINAKSAGVDQHPNAVVSQVQSGQFDLGHTYLGTLYKKIPACAHLAASQNTFLSKSESPAYNLREMLKLVHNQLSGFNIEMSLLGISNHGGLWSKRELTTLQDLDGLRFRGMMGLDSDIFSSMGAINNFSFFDSLGEYYRRPSLDAAFSYALHNEVAAGMHDASKVFYMSPWLAKPRPLALIANRDSINTLSEDAKKAIEEVTRRYHLKISALFSFKNRAAFAKLHRLKKVAPLSVELDTALRLAEHKYTGNFPP